MVILLGFVIVYIVGIIGASQIEKQNEQEKFWTDDNYMQEVIDWGTLFTQGETDRLIQITVVWGLNGVNRDGSSQFHCFVLFPFL